MVEFSDLIPIAKAYCAIAEKGLNERWEKLPIELYDSETYEAIGGLLARQTTLSIELVSVPSIWNAHIAPIIMRCMIDAHITTQWILEDPAARARKYVLYGLGQEKLYIENMKSRKDHDDVEMAEFIDRKEAWLNSQRPDYLTEVNVGSWSELSTRAMAKDCALEDLYKFGYAPCSGTVHNMWHHISWFNLKYWKNPLHNFHKVPTIASCPIEIGFAIESAQYLEMTFCAVDNVFSLEIDTQLPRAFLIHELDRLGDTIADDTQD